MVAWYIGHGFDDAPRTYLGRPTMMSAKSTSTPAMRARKKMKRQNRKKGRRS